MDRPIYLLLLFLSVAKCNPCANRTLNALPYPESCDMYIICWHFFPYVLRCPYDLLFDVNTNNCQPPEIARCSSTTVSFTTSTSTPFISTTETTLPSSEATKMISSTDSSSTELPIPTDRITLLPNSENSTLVPSTVIEHESPTSTEQSTIGSQSTITQETLVPIYVTTETDRITLLPVSEPSTLGPSTTIQLEQTTSTEQSTTGEFLPPFTQETFVPIYVTTEETDHTTLPTVSDPSTLGLSTTTKLEQTTRTGEFLPLITQETFVPIYITTETDRTTLPPVSEPSILGPSTTIDFEYATSTEQSTAEEFVPPVTQKTLLPNVTTERNDITLPPVSEPSTSRPTTTTEIEFSTSTKQPTTRDFLPLITQETFVPIYVTTETPLSIVTTEKEIASTSEIPYTSITEAIAISTEVVTISTAKERSSTKEEITTETLTEDQFTTVEKSTTEAFVISTEKQSTTNEQLTTEGMVTSTEQQLITQEDYVTEDITITTKEQLETTQEYTTKASMSSTLENEVEGSTLEIKTSTQPTVTELSSSTVDQVSDKEGLDEFESSTESSSQPTTEELITVVETIATEESVTDAIGTSSEPSITESSSTSNVELDIKTQSSEISPTTTDRKLFTTTELTTKTTAELRTEKYPITLPPITEESITNEVTKIFLPPITPQISTTATPEASPSTLYLPPGDVELTSVTPTITTKKDEVPTSSAVPDTSRSTIEVETTRSESESTLQIITSTIPPSFTVLPSEDTSTLVEFRTEKSTLRPEVEITTHLFTATAEAVTEEPVSTNKSGTSTSPSELTTIMTSTSEGITEKPITSSTPVSTETVTLQKISTITGDFTIDNVPTSTKAAFTSETSTLIETTPHSLEFITTPSTIAVEPDFTGTTPESTSYRVETSTETTTSEAATLMTETTSDRSHTVELKSTVTTPIPTTVTATSQALTESSATEVSATTELASTIAESESTSPESTTEISNSAEYSSTLPPFSTTSPVITTVSPYSPTTLPPCLKTPILIPDPLDCKYFFYCDAGFWYHYSCRYGSEFSPKHLKCMRPWQAQCRARYFGII